MSLQSMGEIGKDLSPNFLQPCLEGAVTTETGSLFQYFTTLTEKADPLLPRWLVPWSIWEGGPLRPRRVGGRKKLVHIHVQKTREYLEGGNQVSPKS